MRTKFAAHYFARCAHRIRIMEVNVNSTSISVRKKKTWSVSRNCVPTRFALVRVTQSNAIPDCFVNRVSTQRVTARWLCEIHSKLIHAFRFAAKKRYDEKGIKGICKPSYTGKEDCAIFALEIVSPKKIERSASRVTSASRKVHD